MAHHSPRVLQILAEVEGDGALEARMQLAIAAPDVLLGAIVFPIRRRMQLLEGLIVTVGDEVAGALPSLRIARDGGPWTTAKVAIAGQVIEVNRRIDDLIAVRQLLHPLEFVRHLIL